MVENPRFLSLFTQANCCSRRVCDSGLHVQRDALPVKEDPLANSGDGVLRLVERRQLRLQAVLSKGHAGGITR